MQEDLISWAKSSCLVFWSDPVQGNELLPNSLRGKLGGPSQRRLPYSVATAVLQSVWVFIPSFIESLELAFLVVLSKQMCYSCFLMPILFSPWDSFRQFQILDGQIFCMKSVACLVSWCGHFKNGPWMASVLDYLLSFCWNVITAPAHVTEVRLGFGYLFSDKYCLY